MNKAKFFILLTISTITSVVLRYVQVIFLTDAKTGFFSQNFGAIGHIFTAFIILSTAFCGVFGGLIDTKKLNPIPLNSLFFGISSFLLGATLILEAFTKNIALLNLPLVLSFLRTIFIFCSGAVYCYVGVCVLSKKSCDFRVLTISVIAWVLKIMTAFICFSGMSNISDNLYDLLALCVTLLFLLVQSKALCDINKEKNNKVIFPLGAVSVIILATSVFPRLIAAIFNNFDFAHKGIDSLFVSIFMVVYIISYLLNIGFSKEENNK